MLVDRDTLGTCFPFPSPFPGTISFGSFSDPGIFPLGTECCLGSSNSALLGKVVPHARVGQAVTVWCRFREAFALGNRKARFFLGHHLAFFFFILSFGLRLPLMLKVTDFKFQAPSMWICLARFTHSQLTDIKITNKQILLCNTRTPDSRN